MSPKELVCVMLCQVQPSNRATNSACLLLSWRLLSRTRAKRFRRAARPSTGSSRSFNTIAQPSEVHGHSQRFDSTPCSLNSAATGRKLRIGYISRRFEDYAGTQLMLRVFGLHNRNKFEASSQTTARLRIVLKIVFHVSGLFVRPWSGRRLD